MSTDFRHKVLQLVAAVAVVLTSTFALAMLTTTRAQAAITQAAVSCYGDYCSGKDPSTAGVNGTPCANDAITATQATVDARTWWGAYEDVGTLEVRWSPRCHTDWARLSLYRNAGTGYTGFWLTQDTGYQVFKQTNGNLPGTGAGVYWSPMIYSPISRVYARIRVPFGWDCNKCATGWI